MLRFKTARLIFLLIIAITGYCTKVYSQQKNDSLFLFKCPVNAETDTAEIEIEGIGEIKAIFYSLQDLEETGWTYYFVPENKQNTAASKLARLLADMHIQTWKNNSRVVELKKSQAGNASIIDVRLHILIEDIYMQVIAVSEKGELYEIMTFRDTNDKDYFNSVADNVRKKNCLQ